jgi:hypothetical protein
LRDFVWDTTLPGGAVTSDDVDGFKLGLQLRDVPNWGASFVKALWLAEVLQGDRLLGMADRGKAQASAAMAAADGRNLHDQLKTEH